MSNRAQVIARHRYTAAGEPKAQLARELGIHRETLYPFLRTEAWRMSWRAVLTAAERGALLAFPTTRTRSSATTTSTNTT